MTPQRRGEVECRAERTSQTVVVAGILFSGCDIHGMLSEKRDGSNHLEQEFMNDYIEINPRVCGGKPIIRGTRIPLTVIIDQLAETGSIQGVIAKYPELAADQIAGALQYCHFAIEHTELERVAS